MTYVFFQCQRCSNVSSLKMEIVGRDGHSGPSFVMVCSDMGWMHSGRDDGNVSGYIGCYRVTTNFVADRCKYSVIRMVLSADSCLAIRYGIEFQRLKFILKIKLILHQRCIVTFTE